MEKLNKNLIKIPILDAWYDFPLLWYTESFTFFPALNMPLRAGPGFRIDKKSSLNRLVLGNLASSIMQEISGPITDNELIKRVSGNDKAAFREMYTRFSQVVFNLSYRILKDRHHAEEAVQEIFLLIWRKAPDYDHRKGALSTWIINIARNKSIDKLRSLKKRTGDTELTEEKLNSDTDFSRIIEDREEKRKIISKAIYSLPDKQREAIEQVYYEGLTHVEAAEKLGEPVGTIKTRLRLGMQKLREMILPYLEDIK